MRKLFKHIGMICLALAVAVGSFFVPMRKPNQSHMASAVDSNFESYSFTGSNFVSYFFENDLTSASDHAFSFVPSFSYNYIINSWVLDFSYSGFVGIGRVNKINNDNTSTLSIYRTNATGGTAYYLYNGNNRVFCRIGFNDLLNFNGQIYKLDIIHEPLTDNYGYCTFRYYDINDNYIFFSFYCQLTYLSTLQPRTYYFNLASLTDNQIYQDGYNEGYNDSIIENHDTFYNDGYNVGFDDGKYVGKIEGTAEANNYSFISLFGALFDAPVTMLMGLLQFEFLGINLWAFVTSLFTLALVLFIVKLIMGR